MDVEEIRKWLANEKANNKYLADRYQRQSGNEYACELIETLLQEVDRLREVLNDLRNDYPLVFLRRTYDGYRAGFRPDRRINWERLTGLVLGGLPRPPSPTLPSGEEGRAGADHSGAPKQSQ